MLCLSHITMWLLCLFLTSVAATTNEQYYEEMIEKQLDLAKNFTFETNSFSYQPPTDTSLDYGTFDFIIVGAGAAGAVLVRRLSEVAKFKILVLEAGPWPDKYTEIPAMKQATYLSPLNWGYKSIPQAKSCLDMVEQRCRFNRGKSVGGSTILNGVIYARGPKEAFDKWNETVPGWSYNDLLPYFITSEGLIPNRTWAPIEPEYHDTEGPLSVETRIPLNPLLQYWYQANQEKGFQKLDINGHSMLGTSTTPLMTKFGRRQDMGTAYIKPVKQRSNLNISTDSYVTQVLLDHRNKAVGVRFARHNQYYIATATKEVILSAGVFGSPQILMNSGIGPKQHLADVGIPLVQDLPVGSTLRDHIAYAGLYVTTNHSQANDSLKHYVQDYIKGLGSLTVPEEDTAVGFYSTKLAKPGTVDVEIIVYTNDGVQIILNEALSHSKEKLWTHLKTGGVLVYVGTQVTESVGTVRLKNSNFFEYPLIDSNYFSDPNNTDMERLYEGIQLALDLVLNTTAFQAIDARLVKQNLPACEQFEYLSKEYWMCAIQYFSYNIFHSVGSCPMSQSPKTGVVDKDCKVHGVQNLRVVDASVYPMVVPGHPVAQCVAIAEKISHEIKKNFNVQ